MAAPSWESLLGSMIETEILPRLVASCCAEPDDYPLSRRPPHDIDVAAFVDLIVADDLEGARMVANRTIVRRGGRDALLRDLLTPAARLMGEMWETDACDFTTVTLGVFRLDQIMKETEAAASPLPPVDSYDHRILLLPTPGEQHSFGLAMIADAFRESGWCVFSGLEVARPKLLRLVRHEWFDVVGLSVTADRALRGLPACIRAVRQASCNPDLAVMVGGRAIADDAERSRFLGADATANDGPGAVAAANLFLRRAGASNARKAETRLAELG